jgi:hypothetical protein
VIGALLNTLLPGDGAFAAADTLPGLAERLAAAAAPVLSALPDGFAAMSPQAREASLRAIEAVEPLSFERLVAAAYLAYYTAPAVQAVLQRDHGYAARPPQPDGHALPPFDEALLARQKQRAPFWRKA